MSKMFEDYKCKDCLIVWTFSKIAKHHDFPIRPACPTCGNTNTHRVWGTFNFVVQKGKVGNSENGYTGTTNKPQEILKRIHSTTDPIIHEAPVTREEVEKNKETQFNKK